MLHRQSYGRRHPDNRLSFTPQALKEDVWSGDANNLCRNVDEVTEARKDRVVLFLA